MAKGTKCAYMLRNLIPLKIQPTKKIIKNHDKILDIQQDMMQKIP
jgi:hypothetical protein